MTSIVLENVTASYGKRWFCGSAGRKTTAIRDVSLEIPSGDMVAIVGPSGCGKTTLLRVVAGLTRVDSGRVLFDDRDVTVQAAHHRRIAMVFQSDALYSHLTVRQNMAFGCSLYRERQTFAASVSSRRENEDDVGEVAGSADISTDSERLRTGTTGREAIQCDILSNRIDVVAERLGIGGLLGRMPSHLSGGERQRVAIGRTLVRDPAAFLLDEPFSSIDPALRKDVRNFTEETQRTTGTTMVLVTHHRNDARLARQVIVMDAGRIQQVGSPKEISRQPRCRFADLFFNGDE